MVVREWHIVLMGFLQQQGSVNGMVQLWGELLDAVDHRPGTRVECRPWNCDVADLAEVILKTRPANAPPRICLYGYSWGGMTAAKLCYELRRRGLRVDRVVLCDAVYRHWYPLGWWRAFAPWRSIRIPDNVRRVTVFQQRESLPCGHPIRADNPFRTTVDAPRLLTTDHCWMDDHSEFHRACLQAALGV